MKTKVFKAIQTIPYRSGIVKVFYEKVKASSENIKQVKKISKENIKESIYSGFYDLSGTIRKGDYFIIER